MKINKKDFDALESAIRDAIEVKPSAVKQYKDAGLTLNRFAWDLFHYTDRYVTDDKGDKRMFSTLLYEYLNDAHIQTALKRIVEPFWSRSS